jgi:hypothetical protein
MVSFVDGHVSFIKIYGEAPHPRRWRAIMIHRRDTIINGAVVKRVKSATRRL